MYVVEEALEMRTLVQYVKIGSFYVFGKALETFKLVIEKLFCFKRVVEWVVELIRENLVILNQIMVWLFWKEDRGQV